MVKIRAAIISFICHNPKICLILNLIIIALFSLNLSKLEEDFSYKGFYKKDHALYKQYDEFVKNFSGDEDIAIIIQHQDFKVFSKDYLKVISELTEDLWRAPSVLKVTSLTNYIQITSRDGDIAIEEFLFDFSDNKSPEYIDNKKVEAYNDRVLPGHLIGDDKNTTVIALRLRPLRKDEFDYSETINYVRDLTAPYEDFKFNLIGTPMVTETFRSVSQSDLKSIIPLTVLMISLIIFFLYRKIIPIIVSFITIGLTVSLALSCAGLFGIKFNNIISAIPIILMSICIADCIHFFSALFKPNPREMESLKQATERALEHIFIPTLLTSVSTAIGFTSLAASEILPIQGLGILGAIGSLYAWIATLTVCAPLILLIWKTPPSIQGPVFSIKKINTLAFIHHLSTYKVIYLLTIALMTMTMLFLALKNQIDSDPLSYLTDNHPFKATTLFTIDSIGGIQGVDIVIDSSEENGIFDPDFYNKVEVFHDWLYSRDPYTTVISYIDIVRRVSEAMNDGDKAFYKVPKGENAREEAAQYFLMYELSLPLGNSISDIVSLDKKKARVTGLWTLYNSSAIIHEFNQIEKKLHQLDLNGHISGKMPIYHYMNGFVVETFFSSIVMAIILISILMFFIFRSFKLGLISLIPNLIPLIWGAGSIWLMGKNVDMGTVVVGAICMGIALDDTIHFLTHYNKNRNQNTDIRASLAKTLDDIILPLSSTTCILVLGFLVFLIGDFIPNQNLGLLTAIILFLALVMDLIVLPCILLLGNHKANLELSRGPK